MFFRSAPLNEKQTVSVETAKRGQEDYSGRHETSGKPRSDGEESTEEHENIAGSKMGGGVNKSSREKRLIFPSLH